ncbi:MAG TPA: Clp protease N-terminal domain-containing protein [Gaiellaceae bacterium]
MFERFTEQARQVVVQARVEARGFKHGYIGTEHILLGLLCVEEGLAARVLGLLGVEKGAVREEVVALVGEGDEEIRAQIPFSPRAKKVLELSLREALSLGCNYIGTEHILLGLAREAEGPAAAIFLVFNLTSDQIRDEVVKELPPLSAARLAERRPRRMSHGFRRPPAMPGAYVAVPQWEYRIEERAQLDQSWLNELGEDGWELIDITGTRYVFKRRCQRMLRAAG